MIRCATCSAGLLDTATHCGSCGNKQLKKTLPQQLEELEKVIKAARKIIAAYIAKCEGDIPPEIYAAAEEWLEKYNVKTETPKFITKEISAE